MIANTSHYPLKGDLIIDGDFEEIDVEELIVGKEIDYINLEKNVKTLILKKAKKMGIIGESTTVHVGTQPRSKQEVGEAYKIAVQRKVNLNEVKVLNLHFSFTNNEAQLPPTAMMCKLKDQEDIFILVFPDDTQRRIADEISYYQGTRNLLAEKFKFEEKDVAVLENRLNLNLDHLKSRGVAERCAQSLTHEYGHVLHMYVFNSLKLHTYDEQYDWFKNSGYLDIIIQRIPGFEAKDKAKQVYYLKESLVEDYRIWRNQESCKNMFILPNSSCYLVDLLDPTLLKRGIEIMKKMIHDDTFEGSFNTKTGTEEREMDRVKLGREILTAAFESGWTPPKIVPDEEINPDEEIDPFVRSKSIVARAAKSKGGNCSSASKTTERISSHSDKLYAWKLKDFASIAVKSALRSGEMPQLDNQKVQSANSCAQMLSIIDNILQAQKVISSKSYKEVTDRCIVGQQAKTLTYSSKYFLKTEINTNNLSEQNKHVLESGAKKLYL